jgi:aminoacylase
VGRVPEQLAVTLDIRLAVTEDHDEMEAKLRAWCDDVGHGTYYTFLQKEPHVEPTRLDHLDPWWLAFKEGCDAL